MYDPYLYMHVYMYVSMYVYMYDKKYFKKFAHIIKITNSFIWIEISKNLIKNLGRTLLFLCAYISDVNSKYFNPNTYGDIAKDSSNFCVDNTLIILIGDMNSRTGNLNENYIEPDLGHLLYCDEKFLY